ncbi:ATP-binding cassette domain-containing protein [Propionimicrobium sp. PCR01-08-3]|uniref:ATP-binding cassette domain-containing protein n=1 Tax=Propionimicrobium sp. PCR01-08-3 TaxID=3052086 RepID=UPI00255C4D9B|nr:ATP-binding cassette domain-containing protein [Propionimicrobium sp. PCR01-08-3]WIY83794.1 ATP-binding cassette domain-containing protein [Propionimicrobium sp. PCR01-08-3]
MSTEPVYRVRDLVRIFSHGAQPVTAVDRLSFDIPAGQRLGIVGESGSGKSTLIRMMAALRRPTSGDVVFQGRSIVGRKESELTWLRRGVQLVFQDPHSSLDPRMKVQDIIAEPLRSKIWRGSARPDPAQRVSELMAQVGLDPGDRNRYPHQFSGGQRQRIAIARALAPSPEVLIADEAVSALDVSVRAQVLNLFAELVAEHGLTLVFVSHDLSVVRHMCDAVLVMQAGRIVESGPIEQIYSDPQHAYTRQLLASVPRLRRG